MDGIRGIRIVTADLSGADLRGANLSQDKFGGATQLQGTNLALVLVDGADFTGAIYDSATRFPARLDAIAMGMPIVEDQIQVAATLPANDPPFINCNACRNPSTITRYACRLLSSSGALSTYEG